MVPVGESSWLLELGSNERVLAAYAALVEGVEPSVADLVPGATTLLVVLDEACPDDTAERIATTAFAAAARANAASARRVHEVPVRYDGEDLAAVARHTGLAPDEVVERHAAVSYRVAFVGFQPGFAYLAGLPPELHVPRRASPRVRVPRGSVAIGGEWTGVYPLATPGGWNLIGSTELELLAPDGAEPALLQPGDVVRFVPR